MSEPVRVVLFDFDYTLADPSGWVFDALRTGLAAAHLHPPNIAAMKRLIGIPLEAQYTALGGTLTDDSTYQRFKTAYVRYRDAHATTATRVMAEVPAALRQLQHAGVTLGIVSTGADTRIRQILAAGQLAAYFQSISGGWADKAEGIQASLHSLRFSKTCARYIGDRPDDAEAAVRTKVGFIAVLTGAFDEHAFPPATEVMRTMAELPQRLALPLSPQ